MKSPFLPSPLEVTFPKSYDDDALTPTVRIRHVPPEPEDADDPVIPPPPLRSR